MDAVSLVVVLDGAVMVYEPEHVDTRIVDLEEVRAPGGKPVSLPAGVGFEELCEEAGLTNGREVIIA